MFIEKRFADWKDLRISGLNNNVSFLMPGTGLIYCANLHFCKSVNLHFCKLIVFFALNSAQDLKGYVIT